MFVYILQHLITAEVIDGLLVTNHRKPVRMPGIGCCHQIMKQSYVGMELQKQMNRFARDW